MTNALTATKTPQLSSQGVPDVILVLNKQEKYEKTRTEKTKKKKHRKTKERSARTSKGTCTCTRSSTSKGTHTSKKAHAATRSRFYIIVEKMEIRNTNIYIPEKQMQHAASRQ